jgi:hypothetical protein
MKRLINKLEWIIDYYFVYFLYNPQKIDRYYNYLDDKWDLKNIPTWPIKKSAVKSGIKNKSSRTQNINLQEDQPHPGRWQKIPTENNEG